MSPRVVSTIALIMLLVCSLVQPINSRHPARKPPCCVDVTTENISHEVIGDTYKKPSDKGHCVEAIIFKTAEGPVCADPGRPWVKHLIANMTMEGSAAGAA